MPYIQTYEKNHILTKNPHNPDSKPNHNLHRNNPSAIPPTNLRRATHTLPTLRKTALHHHPHAHTAPVPPKHHGARNNRPLDALRSRRPRRPNAPSSANPPAPTTRLRRALASLHGARGRRHAQSARVQQATDRRARLLPRRERPGARDPARAQVLFRHDCCYDPYRRRIRPGNQTRAQQHKHIHEQRRPINPPAPNSPPPPNSILPSLTQRPAPRQHVIQHMARNRRPTAPTRRYLRLLYTQRLRHRPRPQGETPPHRAQVARARSFRVGAHGRYLCGYETGVDWWCRGW